MRTFCSFILLFLIGASCTKTKIAIPEKGVSFALNQYRKQSLKDISYSIELDIPAQKKDTIYGKEEISFQLLSLDSALVIDFSVDSSFVKSVKVNDANIQYQFSNEHIIIDPSNLKPGANKLSIEFIAGNLSLNRNDDYLYTLFVPDRASTCFPLFDQPNLKASYSVTLKTPLEWEAVSNGALKEKQVQNDKNVYVFKKTKPISSYLFAFAAGKFFKTEQEVDGRNMTMYYRETDSIKVDKNKQDIFELHSKALKWLEDYTAIDYPFEKFDFVLIPSFQYGGMEHPGSIFYSESAMFLDENVSVNRKMSRMSLIAHETAHMWFGDLVTMDWFNDVWMKEVFANFMAAKIVQPSFPEIDHQLRFLLSHYPSAYDVDRTAGANPVLQPLGNLKNAGTLYGAIIYQKAPVVMRHLERKIGEELMRESLREYLKTFSYSNAVWDDLVHIIDKRTPDDIEAWSNVWVKTAGMPEYEWLTDGLAQKKDTVSNRIWQQPLKITSKEKDTIINVIDEKVAITLPQENYFLNGDGFSYGYFKMTEASKAYFIQHYSDWKDPVFKASMLMNNWEGMLRGDGPEPIVLLHGIQSALKQEKNPLLIDFLLGQLQNTWWTFLTDDVRILEQTVTEQMLWSLLLKSEKGMKSSYFRAYRNIAMSKESLNQLEKVWTDQLKVPDLILSEEDKIALACELALKKPQEQSRILNQQLNLTKNIDRKKRLEFVMPALSNDIKERDGFFESLKKEENREHEPWVLEALSYLHHPLRAKSAVGYLKPSLDLLQEIQLTGDIFFPQRWLNTTFDGHTSAEANAVVKQFLKDNPGYPFYLKNKILQASDQLERASKMKKLVTIK